MVDLMTINGKVNTAKAYYISLLGEHVQNLLSGVDDSLHSKLNALMETIQSLSYDLLIANNDSHTQKVYAQLLILLEGYTGTYAFDPNVVNPAYGTGIIDPNALYPHVHFSEILGSPLDNAALALALNSIDLSSKVDKTTTVNGHALNANITITKSDVGLGNADNTSDANKPVSTAQAAADASILSQIVSTADTPYNTLKKLEDKIIAINVLLNGDDVNLDQIKELADAIKADESNITALTSGKVNVTDVYNALDYALSGKVLDARQGKVLNDLITALTTAVGGKEPAITAGSSAQYIKGDKTLGTFLTSVLASLLTGIGFTDATAITATDNILQGFGKLQAQLSALATLVTGKQATLVSGTNIKTINGVPILGGGDMTIAGGSGGGSTEPSGQIKSFTVDYSAAGNGTTDDTTAVNNALLANKTIEDNGDFLTTGLVNKYGCAIQGEARILQQTPNIKQQINSYADKNQRIFGEEYLSSFHKKLLANKVGGSTALKVLLSGDSTTVGTAASGPTYLPHNLLASLATKDGVPYVTYTNNGHGGQGAAQWVSTYLSADLALVPDVYILRWGINDSGGTAQSFLDSMDTGLSTIRSNAAFTRDKLAIILQSQNTTTDDNVGHYGQIFNEAVNNGLRALARKYHCCFMDIYGMFQDGKNGQDYLQAINGARPNELVHPLDVFYVWIAQRTHQVLYPGYFSADRTVNDRGTSGILASAGTGSYNIGVNYDYVTTANGWPINGQLITHKMKATAGMALRQEITAIDSILGKISRSYSPVTNQWCEWGASLDYGNNGILNAAVPSATFLYGTSYHVVLASNGFPVTGVLTTQKSYFGGIIRQELMPYNTTAAMYIRTAYNDVYQAWKLVTVT